MYHHLDRTHIGICRVPSSELLEDVVSDSPKVQEGSVLGVVLGAGSDPWHDNNILTHTVRTRIPVKLMWDAEVWSGGPPKLEYATVGSSAFDIVAGESAVVLAGCQVAIRTGMHVTIPSGFELQIRPRSGLAANNHVSITNSPGTVDSDFRGEVRVLIENRHTYGSNADTQDIGQAFKVTKGDRIAQGVISRVWQADFVIVDSLTPTSRGSGGFGSTGT